MNKIFALLFSLTSIQFSVNAQTENEEPLMNLDIYINGVKYQVKEGDTVNFLDNQIVVKTPDYLTFDFGKLRFEYPKSYSLSFEQDYAYKNWTLDGDDFVISYFEIGAESDVDMFAKEMVDKFGKKNCKVTKKEIQIGELKFKGRRINVELMGYKLTYDIFKLNTNDFKSHFIAFQDSKNDDGTDSEESIVTMNIISKTIKQK